MMFAPQFNPQMRQHGMTLIETMLALGGVAVIGMALASFLFATSYATEASKDVRSLVVKHKSIASRFNAAIRASAMVLDEGPYFIVIWTQDTDRSGTPHLAEIRRIEWDTSSNEIRSYQPPDDLNPLLNVEYDLSTTNFNATTSAIKGTSVFPLELWATQVENWAVSLDDSDPHQAVLVSFRLTVRAGDMAEIVIGAAALRTPE